MLNALLALSLAVVVAGGLGFSGQQSGVPRTPEQKAAGDAAWRDGLKAQAQAAGGHYAKLTDWEGEVQYDSLSRLARVSEVVVLGDIQDNECHLSKSGEYITTDYKMVVREVFKGDVRPQTELVFGVMGGQVVFDDGSSAQVETKGFIRPNTGDRVVIFANPFPDVDPLMPRELLAYANGAPIVRPSAMGRSIIEVPSNDRDRVKVKALSANDQLARDTRKKDAHTFLRDLRQAVREGTK